MSLLIALTGATGFIGQYLLRELQHRGYSVRVLLRRPTDLPLLGTSAVIGDLSRPQNIGAALEGVDYIVHSAGLAPTMSGFPEDDYRIFNVAATIRLADAARRAGAKRFVFLSSIRAQSGPAADQVLTEYLEPLPTDAYGKSKLAAELGLAQLDIDWVALRPVLVYGPGVKGNMAQLMRLARSPYPLPLGGLKAKRSLLSLDNLVGAIDAVITAQMQLRRPLIVADPEPLSVTEIMTAMRRGLNRNPHVFPVPASALRIALVLLRRSEIYERLATSLVADPSALMRLGWCPAVETAAGLAALMRA
jgi:nucleoside-diphosphate-sugar epimerase